MKVIGTVMTSSPGLTPAAIRRQMQGRCPRVDAHAELGPDIGGERLFERDHLWAQDVGRALGDLMEGIQDLLTDRGVLGPRSRKGTGGFARVSGSEDETQRTCRIMLDLLTVHVA